MKERVVGIDLGTTNSLVASLEGGRPAIIPGEDGAAITPSLAALREDGSMAVGAAARPILIDSPERAVYSVKRLMGRGVEDVQSELKLFPFRLADDLAAGEVLRIKLGDKSFTPPEISAHILRRLRRNAERFFGEPVKKAVITVPAYFNDAQRQATKDAGRIAGLDVLRLVNEPTAAALAYGLDKKRDGVIAVYDFGGGTFDVSILKLSEGVFEVAATNGDTHLGGDDIDNLLLSAAVDDIAGGHGVDLRAHASDVQKLRQTMIDAKIALSSQEAVDIDFALPGGERYQRHLTRDLFEQLIAPIVERTLTPCRQAMKDAGLSADEIDEVVLVGGSTRIPLVRRRVKKLFRRDPHCDLNPDEVVALGAAVQAGILAGESSTLGAQPMVLLDVTPLSLGIEALGGVASRIIERNSTIPATATENFTTGVDGQTNIAIHVLQGERELARDCRSLARFELRGIPPMPAGLPRIEVRFLIDANGILHVSARELRSGKKAEIDVQPSYGLNDEQVEKMILDSYDFAEQDINQRQVIESRREAETILSALEKQKGGAGWSALGQEERARIGELEKRLREIVHGEDHAAMRDAIDELNQATLHLAEIVMNAALSSALTGQNMAETKVEAGPAAPHKISPADFE